MAQASSEGMKIQAYVMVDIEFGTEAECAEQIEALSCRDYTLNAHKVYGVYDIIVELYAESIKNVKDIVEDVRSLDMVRSTVTAPVMYDKDATANEE